MLFSFYFILTSIVHTHSSIMCYSKLNNISSNLDNLLDSGVSWETDDTCDYLDVDTRMQLKNDPNSLTLIQLNVRGMIGKLTALTHLIKNSPIRG